jgi:type I restriction enzyme R subunit
MVALQIFYGQPYRRRELTFAMIKDLVEKIKMDKPTLAPMNVWRAYEQLDASASTVPIGSPKNELVALVSLIRRVIGIDNVLTPYDKTVDKNFADWVWKKQQGAGIKFTKEQMEFLYFIKEQIATSLHFEADDFELNEQGMLGRAYKAFGDTLYEIIEELNEALAA